MDNNPEVKEGRNTPFVSDKDADAVKKGLEGGKNWSADVDIGKKFKDALDWLMNYKKRKIEALKNGNQKQLSEVAINPKEELKAQEIATLAEKYNRDRSGISKATESRLSAFQQDTAKEVARFTLPDSMNKAA
ncbi:MAG: hypothetical protein WC304_00035 [Candidatus Gracilibacteria bacterium]|jgi:thymidylate synthase ThyX